MGVAQPMVSDELLAEFSEEQLQQVDAIIENYRGKPGALIPVLEEAQGRLRSISPTRFSAALPRGSTSPRARSSAW